ncbi:ATP dependent DNA ligase (fragment) [Paraburkholderia piptadeniae]|uniref:ATP dependent DNA ligase n=1 Tax=Paraburkholderia piptadeniae TaxID=1701573 RepID=A0A1N7SRY4_9BURK
MHDRPYLCRSFVNTGTLIHVTGVEMISTWVWERDREHGFEGMLAKRLDSTYQRGRSRDWFGIIDADYDPT